MTLTSFNANKDHWVKIDAIIAKMLESVALVSYNSETPLEKQEKNFTYAPHL